MKKSSTARRRRPARDAFIWPFSTVTHHPSPELEVLLLCARPTLEALAQRRLQELLNQELNWKVMLRVAAQHGIIPLMFRRLRHLSPDEVPERILRRLRESSQAVVWHNLSLAGELVKLLEMFEKHGITAIPYKGPTLAMMAYGELSLRHFNDLDILMPKACILKAKELLMSQGYQPQQQLADQAAEAEHLEWDCQYNFFHPEADILIELHWRIRSRNFPFGAKFNELWKRTERTPVAGTSVVTMSPEDLIIMLCVHGAKHRWERLNWVCDIAHLMERQRNLNWRQVWEEATRLECERVLLLGTIIANDLIGVPLPGVLRHHARRDRIAQWLAVQVRCALLESVDDMSNSDVSKSGMFNARASGALRRFLFQLAVRKPLRSKAHFIAYLLR